MDRGFLVSMYDFFGGCFFCADTWAFFLGGDGAGELDGRRDFLLFVA